ncbi:hypothetical protein DS901_02065 [Loktanella sp. D2R18]|uniref:hypothetical protein n=1 Tax=Rhodobacterales TaxID=204455 RepID=UPI000DE8E2DE|nr:MULTISPECIES: hypothetical protein [Rhodobacterales]MDO6589924.1 hypothetical protein [Yoonia sp. 1_MG-2023]RBW45930.1 hypothetical protein DS901_02065 [Loktanella sp. D2R18]
MDDTRSPPISANLIWSLRALAQDAETQFRLYQCYDEAADDLVLDFESHLRSEPANFLSENPDIKCLDDLITSKSGIVGYWNKDAMLHSKFWQNIRTNAKMILLQREFPVTAPEPLNFTFINVDEADRRWNLFARLRAIIGL